MQIQARQKARHKLPEWYRQEGIIFPPLLSVEQASSEVTARFKAGLVSGRRLADLSGGMGVDTFYLGQSFKEVDYVEQQPELAELATHNFRVLGAGHIRAHKLGAEAFLQQIPSGYDTLFLDPARRDEHARKVFRLEACSPDVIHLQDRLLAKAGQVLIKTAPLLDINAALKSLRNVSAVYVVAVGQECKEVLYLLERDVAHEARIHAVQWQHGETRVFTFGRSEERKAQPAFAEPQYYIYEPHAAILKAGAFNSLSERLGVDKLHPNSHLYTSEKLISGFPGRIFVCEKIISYSRKALRKELAGDKANITTRNFPDSVQQIRKKTGLKDGGDIYLLATTNLHGKPVILVCRKEGR